MHHFVETPRRPGRAVLGASRPSAGGKEARPRRLNQTRPTAETLEGRTLLSASPLFQVSPTSGLVTTEAGESADFSVRLTAAPTANVTIPVSSSDTGSGATSVNSLTFTPYDWNIPQLVNVTGVSDGIDAPDRAYTVNLGAASSADPSFNGATPASVAVTNHNTLHASYLIAGASGLATTSAGKAASFTVALATRPTEPVYLSVQSSAPGLATTSVSQLVFTTSNFGVPQTVTVTPTGAAATANTSYSIVLGTSTSGDRKYIALAPISVSVTHVVDRAALEAAAQAELQNFAAAEMMGMSGMDPMMQAMLALVPVTSATSVAILSGPWSDPDTWANRQVPAQGANVWVMPGRTVTVDGAYAPALHTVRVSGTLNFATRVSTALRVDTMIVDPTGTLQVGTPGGPVVTGVTATVSFTDTGPIDTTWDPTQLSRGLISAGKVVMQGEQKTGHMQISNTPRAGDTKLVLVGPATGWDVGDQIIVPGAANDLTVGQDQFFRIVAVSADRTTYTLDHPFQYNQPVPQSPGQQLYAADLTRNIVFQSENTADPTRAGHVMFMMNPNVRIGGAAFVGLGRTAGIVDSNGNFVPTAGPSVRGRYAVHFHYDGPDVTKDPAVFTGSVILGSPGWGLDNHESHVIVSDNVAYGTHDSSFVTQDGNETGVFRNNMAISGGTYGFWLHGTGVEVTGNIAAGFTTDDKGGFFIWPQTNVNLAGVKVYFTAANLPTPTVTDPWAPAGMVRIERVPLRLFNNTVYNSFVGMDIRNTEASVDPARPHTIDGGTFWDIRAGIAFNYSTAITTRNVRIYNLNWPTGNYAIFGDQSPADMVYQNVTAIGWGVGIFTPFRGNNQVVGGTLQNIVNIQVPYISPGWAPPGPYKRVTRIDAVNLPAPLPNQLAGRTHYDVVMNRDLGGGTLTLTADTLWQYFAEDQVLFNGKQLYTTDQAAGFVPSTAYAATAGVIPGLDGKTNAQLWALYGLARDGAVAPADAATAPWLAGGLVGSPTTVLPMLQLSSSRTTSSPVGYSVQIRIPIDFYTAQGYVSAPPVTLRLGWNVLPVTVNGATRYVLVRSTVAPPSGSAFLLGGTKLPPVYPDIAAPAPTASPAAPAPAAPTAAAPVVATASPVAAVVPAPADRPHVLASAGLMRPIHGAAHPGRPRHKVVTAAHARPKHHQVFLD